MTVDYRELRQFIDRLKVMEQSFDVFITKFLLDLALRALRKVKKRTPVDKGFLRDNWFITGVYREGLDLVVEIYNTADYATFVEYGHFTRGQGSWVEGRFMAHISLKEIEEIMPAKFERDYTAWLATLGLDAE